MRCPVIIVLCILGLGVLGAPQGDEEIIEIESDITTTTSTNACSAESDSMERVLKVLGDMSEVTELLLEVRRLDRKVTKMGKALKKLGLMEDPNGEFVDPRTTQPTTTTTTDNGPCQDGWHHIGDGCYQVNTEQALTWEESRQQCLLQGSDLAEMNDIDEQRVVTEFLNSWHYGIPFWLGGQKNSRGKWRWEWTESRIQTRAIKWGWAEEFPRSLDVSNNNSTNSCLAIRGRGEVGGMKTWEDQPCEEQLHFMCEYLWIQEYLADGDQEKMSRKLEQNLIDVENLRRARQMV